MQISATTQNPQLPTPAPADTPQTAPAAAPAPASAAAPAVTVTLSPEARAAQNALTAMPMADAVKQLTPGAQGSGTLAQAKSLLLKLADGSGVPQDEQVKAYVDLQKLVFTDPDRAWFTQSTPEDRKAYAAIMDGGQTSLAIRKAADDFNAWGMSQDLHSNVPRKNLAHLNAMSPLQQQMVFAGTASADGTINNGATSLDEWKAQMQVDIVNVDKMIAMDEAEKKSGKSGKKAPANKDEAKVAEDGTTAANEDSPEAKALAALTSPNQGDGVAAAALRMLQKAAAARAEAQDKAEKARKDAEARPDDTPRPILEPYVIGDKVDRTA